MVKIKSSTPSTDGRRINGASAVKVLWAVAPLGSVHAASVTAAAKRERLDGLRPEPAEQVDDH